MLLTWNFNECSKLSINPQGLIEKVIDEEDAPAAYRVWLLKIMQGYINLDKKRLEFKQGCKKLLIPIAQKPQRTHPKELKIDFFIFQ